MCTCTFQGTKGHESAEHKKGVCLYLLPPNSNAGFGLPHIYNTRCVRVKGGNHAAWHVLLSGRRSDISAHLFPSLTDSFKFWYCRRNITLIHACTYVPIHEGSLCQPNHLSTTRGNHSIIILHARPAVIQPVMRHADEWETLLIPQYKPSPWKAPKCIYHIERGLRTCVEVFSR